MDVKQRAAGHRKKHGPNRRREEERGDLPMVVSLIGTSATQITLKVKMFDLQLHCFND